MNEIDKNLLRAIYQADISLFMNYAKSAEMTREQLNAFFTQMMPMLQTMKRHDFIALADFLAGDNAQLESEYHRQLFKSLFDQNAMWDLLGLEPERLDRQSYDFDILDMLKPKLLITIVKYLMGFANADEDVNENTAKVLKAITLFSGKNHFLFLERFLAESDSDTVATVLKSFRCKSGTIQPALLKLCKNNPKAHIWFKREIEHFVQQRAKINPEIGCIYLELAMRFRPAVAEHFTRFGEQQLWLPPYQRYANDIEHYEHSTDTVIFLEQYGYCPVHALDQADVTCNHKNADIFVNSFSKETLIYWLAYQSLLGLHTNLRGLFAEELHGEAKKLIGQLHLDEDVVDTSDAESDSPTQLTTLPAETVFHIRSFLSQKTKICFDRVVAKSITKWIEDCKRKDELAKMIDDVKTLPLKLERELMQLLPREMSQNERNVSFGLNLTFFLLCIATTVFIWIEGLKAACDPDKLIPINADPTQESCESSDSMSSAWSQGFWELWGITLFMMMVALLPASLFKPFMNYKERRHSMNYKQQIVDVLEQVVSLHNILNELITIKSGYEASERLVRLNNAYEYDEIIDNGKLRSNPEELTKLKNSFLNSFDDDCIREKLKDNRIYDQVKWHVQRPDKLLVPPRGFFSSGKRPATNVDVEATEVSELQPLLG